MFRIGYQLFVLQSHQNVSRGSFCFGSVDNQALSFSLNHIFSILKSGKSFGSQGGGGLVVVSVSTGGLSPPPPPLSPQSSLQATNMRQNAITGIAKSFNALISVVSGFAILTSIGISVITKLTL